MRQTGFLPQKAIFTRPLDIGAQGIPGVGAGAL
jgi:hypothetical protein